MKFSADTLNPIFYRRPCGILATEASSQRLTRRGGQLTYVAPLLLEEAAHIGKVADEECLSRGILGSVAAFSRSCVV